MKRARGTGSIFQMKGSGVLWIKYHRNGTAQRESSGSSKKWVAEKLLQKRLQEVATGDWVDQYAAKRTIGDLFDQLRLDYQNNAFKSWSDTEARWRLHLEPVFGHMRALNLQKKDLMQYQNDRKCAGASNGTINREMAVLRRMFTLGEIMKPKGFFPHLDENHARQGFVDDSQYCALAAAAAKHGLWLRAMFEVGYQFGWRVAELENLRVRNVILGECMLRLDVGTTKSGEGREAEMTAAMYELVRGCIIGKAPEDFVFTRDNGKPISNFRDAWEKTITEAGVSGLLFHDLRRTAVRNMVRAGIPERVAMTISGHKTRSVFDRYHIVSKQDISDARLRMEKQRALPEFGQSLGRKQELPVGAPSSTVLPN